MSHLPSSKLTLASIVAGLLGGTAAYILYTLISLISNIVFYQRIDTTLPSLSNHELGLFIIIVPVIGGACSAIIAHYGTRRIRGHGIPETLEAILNNKSCIEPKVAILKPISSALTIGTGGPYGAEGPIIQTGSAIGSSIGQLLKFSSAERKTLLCSGAAAGMAATFGTPLAAVMIAIELLLFEFRTRSLVPLILATVTAIITRWHLIGVSPLYNATIRQFVLLDHVHWYIIFAVIIGILSVLLSKTLYWIEDNFYKIKISEIWWPAISGFVLGIVGYYVPEVLGIGYDVVNNILLGEYALRTLLAILILKAFVVLLTLGAGTSGGILAPIFLIGASAGGVYSIAINSVMANHILEYELFALLGMASLFAACSRAPITFIIFGFEVTQSYNSLVPLMLSCIIATTVSRALSKNSIITEKLFRRGTLVEHDMYADQLTAVPIKSIMCKLNTNNKLENIEADYNNVIVTIPNKLTKRKYFNNLSSHIVCIEKNTTIKDLMQQLPFVNISKIYVYDNDKNRRIIGYIEYKHIYTLYNNKRYEEEMPEHGLLSRSFNYIGKKAH